MLKGCSFEDFEKSHLTENPYNLKGLNVSRKAMETLWLEEKNSKIFKFLDQVDSRNWTFQSGHCLLAEKLAAVGVGHVFSRESLDYKPSFLAYSVIQMSIFFENVP